MHFPGTITEIRTVIVQNSGERQLDTGVSDSNTSQSIFPLTLGLQSCERTNWIKHVMYIFPNFKQQWNQNLQ